MSGERRWTIFGCSICGFEKLKRETPQGGVLDHAVHEGRKEHGEFTTDVVPASLLDSYKQRVEEAEAELAACKQMLDEVRRVARKASGRIEELEGALAGADEVFCKLLEGELCDEHIVDRMANAWGMLGIRKLLTTEQEKGER